MIFETFDFPRQIDVAGFKTAGIYAILREYNPDKDFNTAQFDSWKKAHGFPDWKPTTDYKDSQIMGTYTYIPESWVFPDNYKNLYRFWEMKENPNFVITDTNAKPTTAKKKSFPLLPIIIAALILFFLFRKKR